MPSLDGHHDRDVWWRSLDALADTPEFRAFLEAEFPAMVETGGTSRRRMLQLMGASLALAMAGGCRWKKQDILPFAERPDGRVPGKFDRFASAMPLGDAVIGLEVTRVDGRPIKIEGNPRHPQSLGATDVFAQAALLELYDPDRSETLLLQEGDATEEKTWDQFAEAYQADFGRLRETRGAGFHILAEAHPSPTLLALRSQLLKAFPQAKWVEYEPIGDDNARAGARLAFGRPLRTQLRLDRARVIVCLDADPLGSHPAAVRYARDFAARRNPDSPWMNRLYAVESGISLTGATADHRLPLRASEIPAFTAMLELALDYPKEVKDPYLRAVVGDLLASENQGQSVVCAGAAQPPEVHAAVHRINARLGNVGRDKTIAYTALADPDRPPYVDAIRTLVEEMNAGGVKTLLLLGGNPVYNAPGDVDFRAAMQRVATTIHLSAYRDETSRCSTWHLPRAHFLESWGDVRAYDGTYSIVQPMIAPLRNGRSPIEIVSMILSAVAKDPVAKPEVLVRQTCARLSQGSATSCDAVLRDGLLAGSQWPAEEKVEIVGKGPGLPDIQISKSPDQHDSLPAGEEKWEVIFRPGRSVYDGRFANNGWLQELPEPVTKLTWGNAAVISPSAAEKLGVKSEDVVNVKIGDREARMPVYVLPGQAPGTVELALGYGRQAAGKVGGETPEIEPVGVDVYPLRTTETMYLAQGATIVPTGEKYSLASTQDHFAIDAVGRAAREKGGEELIRRASLTHYREHPHFVEHDEEHPPLKSLWREHAYEGHRWGMSIDLSRCIGCSACVAACQAENNIPVVGKAQVLKGREMQWLRVDRYFRGEPDHPEVAYQPLPCQQCELAPCEQVCPVAATMHSHEGLNDMVYNRCVGTRYCANNCPYKVRRFNFFNYHKEFENPANEIGKMKYNPQVTVRCRGVMEKCTYCVQRIQEAKIVAKNTGKPIRDGQIKTACQQVCPTGAITFGDLADPDSAVLRQQHSPRAYAILAALNIRPRTVYLARICNPNPDLESIDREHERPTA